MSPRALRIIFTILFVFFVVTGLFPSTLLIVLLLTFGLGYPIIFLNTVFLYFLASLPALIALNRPTRAWMQVAIAAAVVPAVAVIPPLLARVYAAAKMEQFRATDFSTVFKQTPKSVEIAGEPRFFGGPNDSLTNAPCGTLCQRLLLSRSVELVRVTPSRGGGRIQGTQLDYRIEERQSCPDAFGDGATVIAEAKDAIASGICFVPRPVNATAVDARIVIQKTTTPQPKNLSEDIASGAGAVKELQTLEISTSESGQWTPRLRKTQVLYSVWRMPTMVVFADCHGVCMGYPVLARMDDVMNPFDPEQAALDALQIRTGEPEKPLDTTARVLAVLDRAGESFTENQRLLINDWARSFPCSHAGCAPTPARDLDLLQRVIKDRRLTDFIFVGDVIARNREFTAANLDLLLDEMDARGVNSPFSTRIGAIVAELENEQFRARRDRLLVLVNASDWKWKRGIGLVSGRLGVDTASLISRRLRDPVSADMAALAACIADELIGRELVPDLLAYLNGLPTSNDFPNDAARDVVKSLARFGHFDEAKDIYLARFPKFGDHSLPRQSAAQVVNDVKGCFYG